MKQNDVRRDAEALAEEFRVDAAYAGYADTSTRVYFYTIRRFLSWAEQHQGHRLDEITGEDLEAWHRHRIDSLATGRDYTRKSNTVYRQATQLRTFFRWCVDTGRLETDPARDVKLPPKGTDRLVEPLTRDQIDQLLRYTKSTGSEFARSRNYALLIFLYDTLLRVSEALSLTIQDVYQDRITVRGKGGKFRTVALNPGPAAAISKYLELRLDASDHLWVQPNGKPWGYYSVQGFLREASLKLGLPDATAHNLRRTAATEMVEADVPTPLIQHIGGWSDLKSMNRYIAYAGSRAAIKAHRLHGSASRLHISP